MPTQKIDPKVIFASNAPAIDNPPVFSDKTKGWDVARANDGRPTIKEMNKVQQDTDLKILWLNENSVTPYDESIDYPDGAVAIKDGSFKQLVSGAWVEFLDDFADKDEVKRGIANRYDPLLTYNSGERVILIDGDIVKSTIDGNTNDPNVDMAGWVLADAPSYLQLSQTSGIGDFNTDGVIHIWCGDSTTEQMQSAGGAADQFAAYRSVGGSLATAAGIINFGGSGYTLNGFVNDPQNTDFIGPSLGESVGILNWDSWFHKPTGSVSQKTALEWRSRYPSHKVIWTLCYGINDLILYAANGNLPKDDIVAYLAPLLRKAIIAIKEKYPQDLIVLRMPNPMTQAPYNAQFPSATAYPTFDTDIPASQVLVEKWNQSLRSTYLQIQGEFSRTVLLDTWKNVFGNSDTTLTAGTQLPFLNDRVHPNNRGYVGVVNEYVKLLTGYNTQTPRVMEADLRSVALSNNPWDNYPDYFKNNPSYKLALQTTLVGIGASYIDLQLPLATFQSYVSSGARIYVVVDGYAAQSFTSYNPTASGSNTRLTGVAPNSKMLTATQKLKVSVYVDNAVPLLANDTYVNSNALTAKEAFVGKITDAGDGFFRFTLSAVNGRISTNFRDGIRFGKMAVGGTVGQTIDFSLGGWSLTQSGGSANARILQFNKAGTNYTTWNNQPAALIYDDTYPSPKAYERARISGTTDATIGTQTAIAHGLGYTPVEVIITPKGNGVVYESATADATNIYVKCSAASISFTAYVK